MGRPIMTTLTNVFESNEASSYLYKAFAFLGKWIASDGWKASGILYNNPPANGTAVVAVMGELNFSAGGAINAGSILTSTTSGWFVAASAGDPMVGRNKYNVNSGQTGYGVFNFTSPTSM